MGILKPIGGVIIVMAIMGILIWVVTIAAEKNKANPTKPDTTLTEQYDDVQPVDTTEHMNPFITEEW